MTILLDTNVLLWFVSGDGRLSQESKELIENTDNHICVSIVSLWEITIKLNIGRLEMDNDLETFFKVVSSDYGFEILNIKENHLLRYLTLPMIRRDPFDRLIYSQAKAEGFAFLFTDEIFERYDELTPEKEITDKT
jgi:PIN domain nuclease of toxin-antitoxin system